MKCFLMVVTCCFFIAACSHPQTVESPCVDFGRNCHQVPINTWLNEGG